MIKILSLISLFLICLATYSCQHKPTTKKVTIAYVNWAEGRALTHLAKILLEDKGYTVTLKCADVAPIFAAVATGDADVFLNAWMPVTHNVYMKKYGAALQVLGINFDNAQVGLVVPAYMDINSIEELNTKAALFNNKIVGIDAGAGIMNKTNDAIKVYRLKFKLQSSGEAAMLAILKKCIVRQEPIVVTGWSPHYVFSKYQLKFLKDPKEVFGRGEMIQTVANTQFVSNNPVLADFFKNFHLDKPQLESLMAAIAVEDQEDAAVKKWMIMNEAIIPPIIH